jgi:hypothetical protein
LPANSKNKTRSHIELGNFASFLENSFVLLSVVEKSWLPNMKRYLLPLSVPRKEKQRVDEPRGI